jgi:hypothetical protein
VATFNGGLAFSVATVMDFGTDPSLLANPVGIPTAPTGALLDVLAVSDLTGDGLDDILLFSPPIFGLPQVFLLPRTGSGTFGAALTLTTPATLFNPIATDLTGDGVVEIVSVAGGATLGLEVLQWNGVAWASVYTELGYTFQPTRIPPGDFNGDGINDHAFAVTSPSAPTGEVRILWGNLGGVFSMSVSQFPVSSQVLFSSTGDLDQNGSDDVVFNVSGDPATSIALGSTGGLLSPITVPPGSLPGSSDVFPLVADMEGDGLVDILQVDSGFSAPPWSLRGWRGNGTGTAFTGPQVFVPLTLVPSVFRRRVVDADGDGDDDLLMVGGMASYYFENRAIYGAACPGASGAPRNVAGLANVGNLSFAVSVENAAPSSQAVLFMSTTADPSPGCGPHIDLSQGSLILPLSPPTFITISASGTGVQPLPIPAAPALAGFTVRTQWAVIDPTGTFNVGVNSFTLSPARTIRVF